MSTSSREPYRTGSSTSYPLWTYLQLIHVRHVIHVVKRLALQNAWIWAWMFQTLYFCASSWNWVGISCKETRCVASERTGYKCREMMPGTSRILFTLPFFKLGGLYTSKDTINSVFDLDPGHSSVESLHHCLIPTTTWCRRRVLTRFAERRLRGWTNIAH